MNIPSKEIERYNYCKLEFLLTFVYKVFFFCFFVFDPKKGYNAEGCRGAAAPIVKNVSILTNLLDLE
jgi:hypothetical protein